MLIAQNISFAYHTQPVLQNINFSIQPGQHIALIGASGCGKSTLLKIIYGLLEIDQGHLFWNNSKVFGPSHHLIPGHPDMKYLSQNSELHGFRTVYENVGHFLSNFEPELKEGRVQELLEIVEMTDYKNTKVENLSGGQRQRIALAKSLAKKPKILLLDEPFGNIDHFKRSSLRRNLFSFLTRNQITTIIATHDKTDVLSFTQEAIVLRQGKIVAKEFTKKLYQDPKSKYIASLFGEVNSIKISDLLSGNSRDDKVLIYPHEIQIDKKESLQAKIKKSYFNGNHYLLEAIFKNEVIFIESPISYIEEEIISFKVAKELIASRIA